jgi:hypothetical protein
MKEPLGRIHPHGSGGKSVYQRAAQETDQDLDGFFSIMFRSVGYILLGLCLIGLIAALACTGAAEIGSSGLVILGAAMALIND